MRKLGTESDVRDGNIVQNEIEPSCTLHQVVTNKSRDLDGRCQPHVEIERREKRSYVLSLGDQLTGVELRDDTLQDFIHDRRQYSLVVVGAEFSVAAESN